MILRVRAIQKIFGRDYFFINRIDIIFLDYVSDCIVLFLCVRENDKK